MKNKIFAFSVIVVVIVIIGVMTANYNKDITNRINSFPYSAETVENFDWNKNEFTKEIPVPKNGKVVSVSALHFESSDKVHIEISNMSIEESDEYIEQIKRCGFLVIGSESNDFSAGICLMKNKTLLSIAYSDGVMGMLIDVNADINQIMF